MKTETTYEKAGQDAPTNHDTPKPYTHFCR